MHLCTMNTHNASPVRTTRSLARYVGIVPKVVAVGSTIVVWVVVCRLGVRVGMRCAAGGQGGGERLVRGLRMGDSVTLLVVVGDFQCSLY